jgi:hypothetical protein
MKIKTEIKKENKCDLCGTSPAYFFKFLNKYLCSTCYTNELTKWIKRLGLIICIIFLIIILK